MIRRARALSPGLVRIGQLLATLALMALLWRVLDGPQAARILAAADPLWLFAGFLALSAQTVLSAMRWRLTAQRLGIRLPPLHALREYYLGQMVNQAMPGGIVGDASRAVRARAQAGLFASAQAVIIERLAGQMAMFAVMAVAFLVTFFAPGGLEWPAWLVLPVSLIIVAGLAVPLLLRSGAQLPGQAGQNLMRVWRGLGHTLAAPDVLPQQLALSLATTFCNLAAFAFCAHAVDVSLPLVAIFALVPLILFTMLIPLTISGWGLREGAAAALLPIAGASPSEGFAASVAFGLVLLASAAPGILALWLRTHEVG